MVDGAAARRVWTVPNAISVGRLLLFGVFVGLLFSGHDDRVAAVVLGVAGVTDFLDGYVARRFGQESELGQFLDPAVDRALSMGTLISLMVASVLPVWLGTVVLCREVVVSAGALVVASRGMREIRVSYLGKLGTFGFMVGLPVLLFGQGAGTAALALRVAAWALIVPSLAVVFVSAWQYVPSVRGLARATANAPTDRSRPAT